MLKIIALVCALSTPAADCDRASALDVMVLRDAVTPIACAVSGQQQIAETGIVDVKAGTYLKIACERPRQTTTAPRAAEASGR